ncbi:PREDICTED: IAA-alanine resistance protein 1-like [Lupinus angustifolius]|uniref:IAA-alanine resistance protein 1-like n=1 Tax=Lupinus angustifolius TaxID=3871 RepID=UPI00092F3EF5|nr:PREDICTED: IAA-alanine resistance protein 1-like [Lupinus angustifolius]XP_019433231.1 PREDICTED: IAA-alanine resistance protein 1-like [Lupinus angustifolius]
MDLFRKPFNSALLLLSALVLVGFCLDLGFSYSHSHSHSHDHNHHQCGGHGHAHAHQHHHHHSDDAKERTLLPEELAEEEDFKLYGFGYPRDHDHHHYSEDKELSGLALWLNALGCSFLVSMASLICLIILQLIFVQGKPSKGVVDSLALFGAGAMLGDAFLHQLPHAFGGEHFHSHDNYADHDHGAGYGHGHSHSLSDLSIGMSIVG